MTVYVDPDLPADGLRQAIYEGNLVILTRLTAVSDFVDYTREQLAELFEPHDPEFAHEHFDKAEMARMLGAWKPRFIHSETSKKPQTDKMTSLGDCYNACRDQILT